MVAKACVCSQVLTTTASKSPAWSNTWRKSTNFLAMGQRAAAAFRLPSFTSHRATMFSSRHAVGVRPAPPAGSDDGDVEFVVQILPA